METVYKSSGKHNAFECNLQVEGSANNQKAFSWSTYSWNPKTFDMWSLLETAELKVLFPIQEGYVCGVSAKQ
jgi:hypothetical protein